MTEYRVFVAYEDGSFASFVSLSLEDFYDTLSSLTGVQNIVIVRTKG